MVGTRTMPVQQIKSDEQVQWLDCGTVVVDRTWMKMISTTMIDAEDPKVIMTTLATAVAPTGTGTINQEDVVEPTIITMIEYRAEEVPVTHGVQEVCETNAEEITIRAVGGKETAAWGLIETDHEEGAIRQESLDSPTRRIQVKLPIMVDLGTYISVVTKSSSTTVRYEE